MDRLQKPRQPRSHHRRRSRSHVRRHQPRALVHRPVRALWAGTQLRHDAVSAAWLPLAPCPTHLLSAFNRTTGSISLPMRIRHPMSIVRKAVQHLAFHTSNLHTSNHPKRASFQQRHDPRTPRHARIGADPCGERAADAAGLSSICVKVPSGIMRHLSASLDTPASTCPPPTPCHTPALTLLPVTHQR